jgi:uncharacterized membrane protein YeaQ/YmgE (transglycosylase-associated protein family)
MGILIFLLIGGIAGWLAGTIIKGRGFGVVGNIVVGIVGAVVGGLLFDFLGVRSGGFLGSIITATLAAVILLYGAQLLNRR